MLTHPLPYGRATQVPLLNSRALPDLYFFPSKPEREGIVSELTNAGQGPPPDK
jgi:hypothetical protein